MFIFWSQDVFQNFKFVKIVIEIEPRCNHLTLKIFLMTSPAYLPIVPLCGSIVAVIIHSNTTLYGYSQEVRKFYQLGNLDLPNSPSKLDVILEFYFPTWQTARVVSVRTCLKIEKSRILFFESIRFCNGIWELNFYQTILKMNVLQSYQTAILTLSL